jgi:uncharacterized membrane protein (UPF0127 family)
MIAHDAIYTAGHPDQAPVCVFDRVRLADSLWAKSVGLMFRRHIPFVLLFDLRGTRCWITNFGVFRTIDLIFLDAQRRVLHIRRRFKPFTPLYRPPRGTAFLIEAPAGLHYDLQVGDQLSFGG